MTTLSHGESQRGKWTRRYRAWADMHRRCRDENFIDRAAYGGRGIIVCGRWRAFDPDFQPLKDWTP